MILERKGKFYFQDTEVYRLIRKEADEHFSKGESLPLGNDERSREMAIAFALMELETKLFKLWLRKPNN